MNTEQIFSSQAINESIDDLFADDEEIPATQPFANDGNQHELQPRFSLGSDLGSDKGSDEILTQVQLQSPFREKPDASPSKEEPILTQVLSTTLVAEPLTQKFIRKFPAIVSRPMVLPSPKKLTEEEIQMRDDLRQSLIAPMEVDYSLCNPNQKFQRPKDEMPAELRHLMLTKGYVSAKEVHCIMSQTETQPASARSLAEEILADFEDIDCETINEIEQHHILDYSLGSLTQKLHSSQRAAELMESSLNQSEPVDLDVTRIDLEALPSDEEDNGLMKCTEELDFDLNYATENFLSPEHSPSESRKLPAERISLSQLKMPMIGFASAGGKSLKINEARLKRFVDNFEKEDNRVAHELEEALKDDNLMPRSKKLRLNFDESPIPSNLLSNFKKANMPVMSRMTDSQEVSSIIQLCVTMDDTTHEPFKMLESPSVSPASMTAVSSSIASSTTLPAVPTILSSTPHSSKHETRLKNFENLLPEMKMPMIGFASAGGKSLKVEESNLKKFVESFEKEDKRVAHELEEAFNDDLTTLDKPKSKKLRLNFESPVPSNLLSRFKTANQQSTTPSMTDSQEVSSIVELCATMDNMTQEYFKVPDSPSVSRRVSCLTPGTSRIQNALSPLAFPLTLSTKPVTRSSRLKLEKPLTTPEMMPLSGFASAGGKNLKMNPSNLKKLAENFEKVDQQVTHELEEALNEDGSLNTPKKPRFKKRPLNSDDSPAPSSPFMMSNFKKGINRQSTPLVRSSFKNPIEKMTDTQELPSVEDLCESMGNITQELVPSPKRKKFAQIRLLSKFNESSDLNSSLDLSEIDSIEQQYMTMYKIEDNVKLERNRALDEQRKLVKDKAEGDRAQMTGTVFMKKSSSNRQKMIDYVGNEQPTNLNRHQITMRNATNYKFLMQNHVNEAICKTNTDGIFAGDNARLVMSEQSKVALEEIRMSFLASPGVDPKLASEKWIENAFKMILVKLASLENSFEKFDKYELLSPDTLLLQMKYRYDREIDRSQRSAIKRIIERDDVPCRRMVLKVVDVHKVPTLGYELELSDGWYSLRSSIDASLADVVDRQKVKVGTKLVTSCAELIGCSGCDPLDMPENVRLKIHANSTRRTSWDAKLGFTLNPSPIRVSLDSVLASGGFIGKLTVVVTHVYEMIYVDSSNDKKEIRSEKLQHRIQNKLDILSFAVYEQVAHQVQQEETIKLRERVKSINTKRNEIEKLSPEEICDLLDFEADADESIFIQIRENEATMRQVQIARDERRHDMSEKIRAKLGEKEKNLLQLIRFRVVDAITPNKTAVISWWSPTEELREAIKEGKALDIIKSTAAPYNEEIQITAGKSSVIKVAKLPVSLEKFEKFFRKETKMSKINADFKPQQNEFDVGCVVVRVVPEPVQDLFKVYVADENTNILCINFWSSLSTNAFDDVVAEGKILYAINLQWRSSHAADKIPQGFVVSDSTLFIPRPKDESQRNRLIELRNSIQNKTDFLIKCNDKIAELQSGNVSVNKENQRETVNNMPIVNPKPLGRPDFSKSFSLNSKTSQNSLTKNKETRKRRLGIYGNRSLAHPTEYQSKSRSSLSSSTTKSKTR